MKLSDKLWLAYNKKQPNKWIYYTTIFFSGFMAMFLLFIGIGFVSSIRPWIGWLILLVTLILVISSVVWDSRKGYVNALHKRHLELWQEKRRKLGVK